MRAIDGSRRIPYRCSDDAIRTFSSAASADNPEPARALPCPLCGSSAARGAWPAQGVVFSRCASCGLWRQDPQPVAESIAARYGDEYLAYETARHLDYRAISLLSLAEAGLRPEGSSSTDADSGVERRRSVLEIGCATGALLSTFAEAGWRATGVEIGESMAEYARTRFGLDVRTGTLETAGVESGSFDAVVATHLIEHLNDPRAFLKEARRALRPDGKLFLVTPNSDGLQARIMGARWRSAIRDHLYLFSARTMRAMLAIEGFDVEYLGTWGGWPAGMRPARLKRPIDAAAKFLGLGDVMILRASLGARKESAWKRSATNR